VNPTEFGQWYYLIYLVPGGAAMLTLMLSALGGMRHHGVHGHGHGHAVGDYGTATGHSSHASTAHTTHAPTHHGAPSHAGPAHQAQHNAVRTSARHSVQSAATQLRLSMGEQALFFLGFGRIPTPFVWGSLLLGWGIFGFWATRALQDAWHYPALFALPALAAGAAGAVLIARLAGSMIVRIMPSEESLAVSTVELVGLVGTTAFPVDGARGRVHVYDQYGTMHDCSARTEAGTTSVERGKSVLVVDYDADHDQLIVEESLS
jgi:hypothetical protein